MTKPRRARTKQDGPTTPTTVQLGTALAAAIAKAELDAKRTPAERLAAAIAAAEAEAVEQEKAATYLRSIDLRQYGPFADRRNRR